jgi:hypothetical protein
MTVTNPNVRSKTSDNGPILRGQPENSNTSVSERIKTALHALGPDRDVPWLAREAGVPASTMYDNLKRGIGKPELAVAVADALKVSVDWLLTGRGDGVGVAKESMRPSNITLLPDAAEQLGMKMIPEVDITYSLGGGAVHDDFVESRMVPFRRDWLERLTRRPSRRLSDARPGRFDDANHSRR